MTISSPVRFVALAVVCVFARDVRADMMFSVTFTAQALGDLSAAEQALFTDAVNFWDGIIIDHRDGVSRNWTLNVDTFSQAAMGGGVLLGSAGPSALGLTNVVAGGPADPSAPGFNGQFIISTGGAAMFNVHPDAGALSFDTIKHEIGHALGIGTLWEDNAVYNDGVGGNSNRTLTGGTPGEYVGAAALAAWQQEFTGPGAGPGATFVPVEIGTGFAGTDHGHWDEDDAFGVGLTGRVDSMGRDMRNELMTGFAAPGDDFFSNTTRMSLFDIGFNVVAVPEPTGFLFAGALAFGFLSRRRRRSAVSACAV